MGFASLPGNEGLKEQLNNAFARGRASHFYLISGPEGSGKQTLARLLAAAFLCQGRDKPCRSCPDCRKVLDGVHPDVIWVTDPEHKNVAVRIIREIRDDLFIRPNEGSHKIYILPQSLGLEGQNALLKVLEEPPGYGVFLLLTDNPETLLPTVRSRCVELRLHPPAEDTQLSAQAEAFAQAFARRDGLLMTQTLAQMERWKRDQLIPELQQWRQLLEGALACRCGMAAASPLCGQIAAARSGQDLNDALAILLRALEYAQSNVSPGAVCGWLAQTL